MAVEAGPVEWSTSFSRWVRPVGLLVAGVLMLFSAASPPAHAATAPSLAVYGWGANDRHTLGTGSDSALVPTPERVPGVGGAAIAAGLGHALALQSDGTVVSWGVNDAGQLGQGTIDADPSRPTPPEAPGRVVGLNDVVAIAAGDVHSLAVRRDGTVWAWGANNASQLGGPPSDPVAVARPVPGVAGITGVAAGDSHSVAVDRDDHVWTWGDDHNNQLGRNGDGSTPGLVEGVDGAVAVAAFGDNTVALLGDGHVMFWGTGGNTPARQAEGVEGAIAVAQGYNHTLALAADGTVFGWGAAGPLGEGGTVMWPPQRVSGVDGVRSIAAGYGFSLFATNDGRIISTGARLGQPPDPSHTSLAQINADLAPRTVATLPGLTSVTAGTTSAFALAGPQAGSATKPTTTTSRVSPITAPRTRSTTPASPPVGSAVKTGNPAAAAVTTTRPAEPTTSTTSRSEADPTTTTPTAPSAPHGSDQQAAPRPKESHRSPWAMPSVAAAALSGIAATGIRVRKRNRRRS